MNEKISKFLRENCPATPCLVLDLDVVKGNYEELRAAFPYSGIYYAVKANPAPDILRLLAGLGSFYDAASVAEVEMVLASGAVADRISYGNTIKKEADIARAYALGVRTFAFDSAEELDKIARSAPGSRVFCRILVPSKGADWPLSRKFGCDVAMARGLLLAAVDKGVEPFGVSFHVGSQQRDPEQWDGAIRMSAELFHDLSDLGVELKMLNLGGGFPTRYREDVPSLDQYADAISESLFRHFGNRTPLTIVEPGRSLVGDAGVIQSEVVLISKKSEHDERRWVYLDVGKFGGLAETMDEAIQYPITSERSGEPEPVILAGPTCDGADILYERADYRLPNDLAIGDRVEIHGAGAYTSTYSSIGFNGFDPLGEHYI